MRRPVAVIAGAGEAGAATAVSLAGAGFAIVLVDVRAEVAQAAAAQVVEAGGVAEAHGVDLLDMDSVTALRDQLVERLGGVDVVVHLVGGWRGTRTLEPQSVENWRILHPPIVDTLAVLTTVFAADIAASPRGRVLMVSSTAVSTPTAGNIAYATAKMAAETWMGGVAHHLRETSAASIVVAVRALLTDAMTAADPEREWTGHTHVRDLARAITAVCTAPAANGSRLDLTAAEYSTP